jgi:hypothetical protein
VKIKKSTERKPEEQKYEYKWRGIETHERMNNG